LGSEEYLLLRWMRLRPGGYARVSTRSLIGGSQLDVLRAAGCEWIWTDTASDRIVRRPERDTCLDYLRPDDELVITRLSRMTLSVRHLTEIAVLLTERDHTTPAGRFLFHVIGQWMRCWPT
jgi:DNA invertase Pin-like site-specific DNA recombinase